MTLLFLFRLFLVVVFSTLSLSLSLSLLFSLSIDDFIQTKLNTIKKKSFIEQIDFLFVVFEQQLGGIIRIIMVMKMRTR